MTAGYLGPCAKGWRAEQDIRVARGARGTEGVRGRVPVNRGEAPRHHRDPVSRPSPRPALRHRDSALRRCAASPIGTPSALPSAMATMCQRPRGGGRRGPYVGRGRGCAGCAGLRDAVRRDDALAGLPASFPLTFQPRNGGSDDTRHCSQVLGWRAGRAGLGGRTRAGQAAARCRRRQSRKQHGARSAGRRSQTNKIIRPTPRRADAVAAVGI